MRLLACLLLAVALAACGGDSTGPPDTPLPASPEPVSPVGGAQVTTDTPTFTVRNASGYDGGQGAEYIFSIRTRSGTREILELRAPAGRTTTSVTPPSALPRGTTLTWYATASSASGRTTSNQASFRTPSVQCLSGRGPYAKSVVEWSIPECSLRQNIYNDPNELLGPPDAGGKAPDMFFGFISLGYMGHVSVDMETCAVDQPGPDVRVYQSVSGEEVTLYAAGTPSGPWQLLEAVKRCGTRSQGLFSNHCDFDLADAELEEARYFKIEDGELTPCEDGDTETEGADVDAIQILNPKP